MSGWQGPPVLVGEKALWLGSGSGLPKPGIVRWIGHLPEIGPDWTVGLELSEALPFGGIDGSWGGRTLFTCKSKHGLLVPISSIIPGSQLKHIPSVPDFERSQNVSDRSSVVSLSRYKKPLPQPSGQPVVTEEKDQPRPALRQKRRIPTPPTSSDSDEPSKGTPQATDNDQATLRVEERDQEDSLKKRLRLFTENNGQVQRMNRHYNACSVEEVVIDSLYAQRRQQFTKHGRSQSDSSQAFLSSSSSPGSRRERSSSALFSIFRWFRKESRSDDFDTEFTPSAPPSPQLIRGYSSSCGSVDTLFSTATASSFAFIHPAFYRPLGAAHPPDKRITEGPETDTYRNRLRQRDRIRELDKNLTLKKKYHLFGSDTLHRGTDDVNDRQFFPNKSLESLKVNDVPLGSKNSTLGRKKRKAPPPPLLEEKSKELSLPNTLQDKNDKENLDTNAESIVLNRPRHRRTVSDSAKDRKSGVFVHVRGKRKAPPPPTNINNKEEKSSNREILGTQSLGRKKRHAPPPPLEIDKTREVKGELSPGTPGSLSPEEKQRLIDNIARLQAHADRKSLLLSTPPASPTLSYKMSHTVCNDSLKLERGVLKANKTEVQSPEAKPATPTTPTPVSPRPWYKRNVANKEKSLEKKKDKKKIEDWMPEVAIARGSMINQDNQFTNSYSSNNSSNNSNSYRLSSIFSRFEKPEEKRKSQISMLVNISELDREAAEIVQREQEKERAMLAANDAKYYTSTHEPAQNSNEVSDLRIMTIENKLSESPDSPRKSGARELISLFNAIGNVTKVTVNSAFFSKDGPSIFTKEGIEKRFSLTGDSVKASEEKVVKESVTKTNGYKRETVFVERKETYLESPGIKRRRNLFQEDTKEADSISSGSSEAATPEVVIEEIEESDTEKSKIQALYEANKIRKHHSPSPSIPTIAEMSESISSVTTSPGSTINASERSTSITPTPVALPVKSEVPVTQPTKNYSIWSCPRCTLENPRWRVTCEACDMWRPAVRKDVIDKLTNANMGTTIAVNVVKAGEPKNTSAMKSLTSSVTSEMFSKPNAVKENSNVSKIQAQVLSRTPGTLSASASTTSSKIDSMKPLTVSGLLSNSSYKPKEVSIPENHINSKVKESNVLEKKNETEFKSTPDAIAGSVSNNGTSPLVLPSKNFPRKIESVSQKECKTKEKPYESSECSNETSKESTSTKNESDLEEVRKARLAFFQRSQSDEKKENEEVREKSSQPSINQAKIDALFSIASRGSLATNDEERLKVKEILKEMKNSLPKKSKQNKSEVTDLAIKENLQTPSCSLSGSSDAARLGAIKKQSSVSAQSNLRKKELDGKPKNDKKAEVYLVTSETVIEEIKVKSKEGSKSLKVSTSAQTNGVIRKVEPDVPVAKSEEAKSIAGKPPTPKSVRKEILVPVTVEEHEIREGIVEKSTRKEPQKMAIGAFQLLRPRDFANIEATKTGNEGKLPVVHTYANIPSTHNDDSSSSTSSTSSDGPEISQLTAQLSKPKGLADFKAAVLEGAAGNKMNTLAVNRLLRQLESAIAGGQHQRAATLAKELARHKVNCSVTRHKQDDTILVDMYVEDKLSHKGPFPVQVSTSMTVAQLKDKVEKEFEIPSAVQRWILGKQLAADDTATLQQLAVNKPHCPIFLYLVAPDIGSNTSPAVEVEIENEASKTSSTPKEEVTAGATAAAPPPGRGWYFNEENDRYSFCESEATDVSSKDPSPEPQVEVVPEVAEVVVVEEVETEDEGEEVEIDVEEIPAAPTTAAEVPITNPTGTLAIGWKCTVCTLVNSPTRPGCLACATDRPADYIVPLDYQASGQEQLRLDREQQNQQAEAEDKLRNYQELMVLEKADLIPSAEPFECSVCLVACEAQEGVTLRDCLHTFCRPCLANTVQFTDEAEVKCPFRDQNYACDSTLQEREIKALVTPEVYEQHLAKSVAQAENKIGNAFHCKTPDCPGWCIFEDNVNTFQCPVCNQANCLTCQAIHLGVDCKQYQEQAKQEAETNADARRTREMLEEMVQRGEALPCPTCQVVLMKKWGCDWLRCSMCKTEICWVTRGPRWGPNGKGDTSGGCQCGVNGVKCHPKCNYCH